MNKKTFLDIQDLFNQQDLCEGHDLNVVITGDSLAYNRYDFDHDFRANANNCYPGMPSWSFLVRDALQQNDCWYIFGDELHIEGYAFTRGNMHDEMTQMKYSCCNHGKAATLRISDISEGFITYKNGSGKDKAILYLQKRPDKFSCTFDVYVDEEICKADVDLTGNLEYFKGWEILCLDLPMSGDGHTHKISFRNVRNNNDMEKRITICGIGTKRIDVHLTGSGGKTSQFFLENINERILKFNPDFVIFIIGANDRVYLTLDEFRKCMSDLLLKIVESVPNLKMLIISPPSSKNIEKPEEDILPRYISDKIALEYNTILKETAKKIGYAYLDLFELFEPYKYELWRYDNVHLTKAGNEILAKKVLEIILPEGKYKKETVSTTWWV